LRKHLLRFIFIYCSLNSMVGAQTFFECTPSGQLKKIIPETELAGYNYYARVEINGTKEKTTMYKNMKEYASLVKTQADDGYSISFFQEDFLISTAFYKDGRITSEQLYDENNLVETRVYTYNKSGFPSSIEAKDAADSFIYTEKYYYHSNNSLLQIIRTYADETTEFIAYTYDKNGNLKQSYESFNTESTLSFFIANQKKDEVHWNNEEKQGIKKWEQQGRFKYLIEQDLLSGKEYRYQYNEANQLLKTVEKLDVFIKITDYEYTSDKLSKKKSRSAGLEENWDYRYDDNGLLVFEEYSKNGEIIKTVEYFEDDRSIENIYRNSKPFLKIEYIDGKRVSQEYLSNETEN
jgi:hypothetical protein